MLAIISKHIVRSNSSRGERQERRLTRTRVASSEGIADVVANANTVGRVHNDSAFSVETTGAGARVLALLVDAGQLVRAVAVADALGSTVGWGAKMSWQAGARRAAGCGDHTGAVGATR